MHRGMLFPAGEAVRGSGDSEKDVVPPLQDPLQEGAGPETPIGKPTQLSVFQLDGTEPEGGLHPPALGTAEETAAASRTRDGGSGSE